VYFNIQRFSTHDGDGIRSILFLKGCSLSCRWCANPESRSAAPELLYDARRCLEGCALCSQACPAIARKPEGALRIDRQQLTGEMLEVLRGRCPSKALTVCGETAEVETLCETLLRDQPFYLQSGGGVTFSGGEPLLQPELVAAIARRMHQEGINNTVETCLHVPWKNIEQVLPHIDCWLADLKHTDETTFRQWTEGSLKRIKTNLRKLALSAKRLIIRVPVVPGFNDSEEALRAIIDFAASLTRCDELHLLPYHTLGIGKYELLDMPYTCSDKPLSNPGLLASAKTYAETHPVQPMAVTLRG